LPPQPCSDTPLPPVKPDPLTNQDLLLERNGTVVSLISIMRIIKPMISSIGGLSQETLQRMIQLSFGLQEDQDALQRLPYSTKMDHTNLKKMAKP